MADRTLLTIGRICIGLLFFFSGIFKAVSFNDTAGFMKSAGIPLAEAACVITIILLLACSVMLFIGRQVRVASLVLIGWLVIVTLVFHTNFPEGMTAFLKNIAIIGGLFSLAANN